MVKANSGRAGDVMTYMKDQRLCRLGLMLLVLGLLTAICRPLLLLILPGIIVIFLPWWRQRFLSELASVRGWSLYSLLDCDFLVPALWQDPSELLGLWGTRAGDGSDWGWGYGYGNGQSEIW